MLPCLRRLVLQVNCHDAPVKVKCFGLVRTQSTRSSTYVYLTKYPLKFTLRLSIFKSVWPLYISLVSAALADLFSCCPLLLFGIFGFAWFVLTYTTHVRTFLRDVVVHLTVSLTPEATEPWIPTEYTAYPCMYINIRCIH